MRRVRWPGAPQVRYEAIQHVPFDATVLQIGIIKRDIETSGSRVELRPLGQLRAAAQLVARNPSILLRILRGKENRSRLPMRRLLAEAVTASDVPARYAQWIRMFDTWEADDLPAPVSGKVRIGVLVWHCDQAARAPLAASVRSVEQQFSPVPCATVTDPTTWQELATGLNCDYVLLLQAGEVLPRHASRLMARQLHELGRPAMACADEDALSLGGERRDPSFKPRPNRALMLSGTLTRGSWLVRRDVLTRPFVEQLEAGWAEALRLDLWLHLHEADSAPFSERIPFVLAHRRPDAETAPPALLADVADRHLRRAGLPMRASPARPLRIDTGATAQSASVSIIIPSTLRAEHTPHCVRAVLTGTAYAELDVTLVVSQPAPPSAEQLSLVASLNGIGKLTPLFLRDDDFNFSRVNNRAIAATRGDIVCLMNDDVLPLRPDWLDRMMAHLADPHVGIVGARLLYADGTLQHGGVLMGMSGLCDHANRHLPMDEPGYGWRAVLAQEFSAVTAACMLVRRSVLEEVGGLDEGYPSAYNDVDLCLRVRERGHAVVYAPDAELTHLESKTYGGHYDGERGAFRAVEEERLRSRWAEWCRSDPFHNPNLSLEYRREWTLAFPPRVDRP